MYLYEMSGSVSTPYVVAASARALTCSVGRILHDSARKQGMPTESKGRFLAVEQSFSRRYEERGDVNAVHHLL
jgi:hypothetical protein